MERVLIRFFIATVLLFGVVFVAKAQSSQSRYKNELVFSQYMKNFSIGVSPTISKDFMFHPQSEIRKSVTMPAIHFAKENCFADFGNAGSLGWGIFASYGRYKYTYLWDNGYGEKEVNVRAGHLNMLVGMSYHYTIKTRLEAYARFMVGANTSGFKNDLAGSTYDWNANLIWNGVAGVRYYFSNSLGLYVEGGHTMGVVNAGITYRWQ